MKFSLLQVWEIYYQTLINFVVVQMRDQSHIINFVEIKKVTETGGIGGKPN